jgi:L-ascorbate metabolism protein UlaG (beta-lactamase superfamily)
MAVQEIELPARRAGRKQEVPGSIYFVGTATMIIHYAGYTILTDPNFLHKGESLPLGFGLFTHRQTNPAVEIDDLPPIDLVLVSHLHADHFDRVAMTRLDKKLPLIAPPKAAQTLLSKGFSKAMGLPTWESIHVDKPGCPPLRITAMPGKHAPGPLAAIMPPVIGSLLEFGEDRPFRLFISGDTLIHEEFKQIPNRVPPIHLAILHLGGTRILGLLVTMDDQQGMEALRLLNPQRAIPIHYNDYPIFKSPLDHFQRAVIQAGWQDRVHFLHHGESFNFQYDPLAGFRDRA